MPLSSAVWCVIVLALLAANLPFINQRLFAVVTLKQIKKSFWLRLLELIVCYFVIGALGFFLEAQIGNAFPQTWEFYAISACLFIVAAFPSFVFQYLRKQ